MAETDIQSGLLDRIYESALAPEKWGRALDGVAAELKADLFQLVGWDEHSQTDLLGVRAGPARCCDPRRYRSYHRETPMVHTLPNRMGNTTVLAWSRAFCDGFRPVEAHCRQFLCSDETPHSISGSVLKAGSTRFEVALLRSHDKAPFAAEEHAVFDALFPHLRRTLQLGLTRTASTAEWAARISQAALDTTALGVAAFNRDEQLCYLNGRGKALLLAAGIDQTSGIEQGGKVKLVRPLGEILRTVRDEKQTISTSLPLGNIHLCVTALPLLNDRILTLGKEPVAVILLMAEAKHQRVATARQLIQLFGLTPAETRLARAIAQGESVDGYAQAEDVSPPTVRAQLRKVFAKTGTDRQGALVKLLTAIPVVRT